MSTILLTGATGQVGWELQRSLSALGAVMACDRRMADLSAPARLRDLVETHRPAVLINAAAYTAVDRAEQDEAAARVVNGVAPGVLAEAARAVGAVFVHYSTDYVFDGECTRPYRETDPPSPINIYGASKLQGEQAIQVAGGDWLVLRTSWVYAARGDNFLRTMLKLAQTRNELRIVSDQIGAPTSARLIADWSAHIVRHVLRARDEGRFTAEVLHLSAAGATTWFGFACALLDEARAYPGGESLRAKRIEPIPSSAYPTPARRPRYSLLDNSRMLARLGLARPDWRIGMRQVLAETAARES